MGRVNVAADALAWEETITAWVAGLTDWCNTSTDIQDPSACVDAITWGVPLAFKALVASDRIWVNQFCMSWGACA